MVNVFKSECFARCLCAERDTYIRIEYGKCHYTVTIAMRTILWAAILNSVCFVYGSVSPLAIPMMCVCR